MLGGRFSGIPRKRTMPTHAKPTKGVFMLLDRLPNHLHLARNSNAPEFDRWRLYSSVTHEYFEKFSGATPDEVMQKYVDWEEAERKAWVGA